MKYTIEQLKEMVKKNIKSTPKILIFDIETATMEAYVWKRYEGNSGQG